MKRNVSLETVRDAAQHVYAAARRTPLVPLHLPPDQDRHTRGPRVFLKLETLQPIGSFKIRGAFNAVRQLTTEQLAQGVWTVSSGNAAQGVALAARAAGARCRVLCSDAAPQTKLDSIASLDAEIVRVTFDEAWRTVESRHSDRMTGHFVHPFDDDAFISGNGTIALEILEDLPDVDAVIAPMGGGGLLSGLATVLRALSPQVKVYAAEPATAAPLAYSLERGEPSSFPDWRASFVDGAGGKSVIPSMWPFVRELDASIVVTLDEVASAMRNAAERTHVVAEGAAGCAIAAALSGRAGNGNVVAVVSGGNIDLARFASVVGACTD